MLRVPPVDTRSPRRRLRTPPQPTADVPPSRPPADDRHRNHNDRVYSSSPPLRTEQISLANTSPPATPHSTSPSPAGAVSLLPPPAAAAPPPLAPTQAEVDALRARLCDALRTQQSLLRAQQQVEAQAQALAGAQALTHSLNHAGAQSRQQPPQQPLQPAVGPAYLAQQVEQQMALHQRRLGVVPPAATAAPFPPTAPLDPAFERIAAPDVVDLDEQVARHRQQLGAANPPRHPPRAPRAAGVPTSAAAAAWPCGGSAAWRSATALDPPTAVGRYATASPAPPPPRYVSQSGY